MALLSLLPGSWCKKAWERKTRTLCNSVLLPPYGPSEYLTGRTTASAVPLPWCISATGCASLTVPWWCNSHWLCTPKWQRTVDAPPGSGHNSSAFSPEAPQQRGGCPCAWHKWSPYRAQMSRFSRSHPYILHQLAVKHEHPELKHLVDWSGGVIN